MNLERYIEAMRSFKEREGYYPNLDQIRHEQVRLEREEATGEVTDRSRFTVRKRDRHWK